MNQLPPIKVQKLRPSLFLVTGANANTVVFVRSTDVVVIDIFVLIPALRVLLTGDASGGKFLPALGRANGGDGVEYPNALTKALPLTRDIDMIITGHGGVAKPQDLAVHRDFMRDFLESTRQAKKAGQTAAAAAKGWKLPARDVGSANRRRKTSR